MKKLKAVYVVEAPKQLHPELTISRSAARARAEEWLEYDEKTTVRKFVPAGSKEELRIVEQPQNVWPPITVEQFNRMAGGLNLNTTEGAKEFVRRVNRLDGAVNEAVAETLPLELAQGTKKKRKESWNATGQGILDWLDCHRMTTAWAVDERAKFQELLENADRDRRHALLLAEGKRPAPPSKPVLAAAFAELEKGALLLATELGRVVYGWNAASPPERSAMARRVASTVLVRVANTIPFIPEKATKDYKEPAVSNRNDLPSEEKPPAYSEIQVDPEMGLVRRLGDLLGLAEPTPDSVLSFVRLLRFDAAKQQREVENIRHRLNLSLANADSWQERAADLSHELHDANAALSFSRQRIESLARDIAPPGPACDCGGHEEEGHTDECARAPYIMAKLHEASAVGYRKPEPADARAAREPSHILHSISHLNKTNWGDLSLAQKAYFRSLATNLSVGRSLGSSAAETSADNYAKSRPIPITGEQLYKWTVECVGAVRWAALGEAWRGYYDCLAGQLCRKGKIAGILAGKLQVFESGGSPEPFVDDVWINCNTGELINISEATPKEIHARGATSESAPRFWSREDFHLIFIPFDAASERCRTLRKKWHVSQKVVPESKLPRKRVAKKPLISPYPPKPGTWVRAVKPGSTYDGIVFRWSNKDKDAFKAHELELHTEPRSDFSSHGNRKEIVERLKAKKPPAKKRARRSR